MALLTLLLSIGISLSPLQYIDQEENDVAEKTRSVYYYTPPGQNGGHIGSDSYE